MANKRVQLVPSGAGTPTREDTNTGEWDFLSIRIGADTLPLEQEGTGPTARLSTTARISAAEGTELDDLVTKGQAESYASGLVGGLTASEGLTRDGDDFQIAVSGVTEGKIADDAVTQDKIGDSAVGTDQLADDAVTQDKIADDAVGTDQLATGSVTADAIATGAVDNDELADEAVTGDKLNTAFRARLGIDGDLTYEAYSSTTVVGTDDTYPAAISKVDAALDTILTDVALEEVFVVPPGGLSSITLTTFTLSSNADDTDITVRVNGKLLTQSTTSYPSKDFAKSGTTQILFSFSVLEGAEIVVRKERTGAVSGGGGTIDLSAVDQNIIPDNNNTRYIGSTTKGWKSVFLSDIATGGVYQLQVNNGVLEAVLI
jgi:hypothetical protein